MVKSSSVKNSTKTSSILLISVLMMTTMILDYGHCRPTIITTTAAARTTSVVVYLSSSSSSTISMEPVKDYYRTTAITTDAVATDTTIDTITFDKGSGRYRRNVGSSTNVGQQSDDDNNNNNNSSTRIERSTNLSHITGTARKIRMFIRNRYLQIFPDGSVNGTIDETSDYTILQRMASSSGQVKIQGLATCMFLCMDSCGLLFGSRDFADECLFNELIGQHHYDTYSSAKQSNDKRVMYIGMDKKGASKAIHKKVGESLGKDASLTKILPQPVESQRVEQLENKMMSAYPTTRDHHLRHRQICPPSHHLKVLSESPKCMKRRRRKMLKNCEDDDEGDECVIKQEDNSDHPKKRNQPNRTHSATSSSSSGSSRKKCAAVVDDPECRQHHHHRRKADKGVKNLKKKSSKVAAKQGQQLVQHQRQHQNSANRQKTGSENNSNDSGEPEKRSASQYSAEQQLQNDNTEYDTTFPPYDDGDENSS